MGRWQQPTNISPGARMGWSRPGGLGHGLSHQRPLLWACRVPQGERGPGRCMVFGNMGTKCMVFLGNLSREREIFSPEIAEKVGDG